MCKVAKMAFLVPLVLNEPLLLDLTMMTINLCLLSVKQAQAELPLTIPARRATSETGTVGISNLLTTDSHSGRKPIPSGRGKSTIWQSHFRQGC